jgi:hypothetical protein
VKSSLSASEEWGYDAGAISPEEIVRRVRDDVRRAIAEYEALPHPDPCGDKSGYRRVSIEVSLTSTVFDQLMNGATGYRAHYAAGIDLGEQFNQRLLESVAPMIIASEQLYASVFDRVFCERSLLGPFSKFWFSKQLTDPSAQAELLKCTEEIRVSRWVEYWSHRSKPRKGLLAPRPTNPVVLLNGTFVNAVGEVHEQKPGRSKQLFNTGWT